MSFNRIKSTDKQQTASLIGTHYSTTGRKNWLGHINGKGAAAIDTMLLVGATMNQLESNRRAVKEHLWHLENEHGLTIIETNGIFKFK